MSAIIPVFNSSKTLKRAIDSLLIQPEISEIFIVDDGSNDGSLEIALEIAKHSSFIKVLVHENFANLGACASRNLALRYSNNSWIQFLDADDELLFGKISNQIMLVAESCPFIVGESLYIKSNKIYNISYKKNLWHGLLIGKLGNTCANLWNKSAILNVGGWDENLMNTQEYDLMFRMLRVSQGVKFSKGFYTNIYKTQGSISFSSENLFLKRENLIKLRIRIKCHLLSRNQFDIKTNYYYSAYIGSILIYHKSLLDFSYSKYLFLIYKMKKSIIDRIQS